MKTIKSILALAIMAAATVFASCSKDDDVNNVPSQKEIETKIIGKWKSTMDMGMHKGEVLTNGRVIYSYNADHTGFASHSARTPEGYSWDNKSPFSFSLIGNVLSEKPEGEHIMERSFKITAIDDNSMTNELSMPAMPDEEKMPALVMTFTKVTADYSNDIIGLWEGVEMTGYETYGNAEARIEYRADGTYTYYQKVDGYWVPSADADNEYNVDGDWLATRWRPEAGADYNYEWWDIDYIKDGMMKWSALREKEDGTRFNTTFTWKKVDDSASAQNIKANIVGSWQIDHVVRYEITDGNVIHKDIIPYDFMVSTISYTSDLTFSTYDYFVDSEQPGAKIDETRAQGIYSVTDKLITHTFDDEPSKMYSNMVYSIDSQTMVIINHFIEGKTEFFSLTYYRKL